MGKRNDAEIARVMRYGVHANGNAVLNFIGFQGMSDGDLTAVVSYLRTSKPVATRNIPHEFNLAGRAIKAFMVKPVGSRLPIKKSVKPDSIAEYEEYLVSSTTNCMGCHTQPNLAGELSGPLMAVETTSKVSLRPISPHTLIAASTDGRKISLSIASGRKKESKKARCHGAVSNS